MNTEELQLLLKSSPELLNFLAKEREHEAKKEFFAALCNFQAECPIASKTETATVRTRKGGTYEYHYASLSGIQKTIAPVLHKHKLSVFFDSEEKGNGTVILCKIAHVGGHHETTRFFIPIDSEAMMNNAQKAGTALSYGRRYALCAALFIVADEDDDAQSLGDSHGRTSGRIAQADYQQYSAPYGEKQTPGSFTESTPTEFDARQITQKQRLRLEARINEFGLSRDKIKHYCVTTWGVDHFEKLNRSQYRELDQIIDDIAEKKSAEPKNEMMEVDVT